MDNEVIASHLNSVRTTLAGYLEVEQEQALREAVDVLCDPNRIVITDSSGECLEVIDGSLADYVLKEGVKRLIISALEDAIERADTESE